MDIRKPEADRTLTLRCTKCGRVLDRVEIHGGKVLRLGEYPCRREAGRAYGQDDPAPYTGPLTSPTFALITPGGQWARGFFGFGDKLFYIEPVEPFTVASNITPGDPRLLRYGCSCGASPEWRACRLVEMIEEAAARGDSSLTPEAGPDWRRGRNPTRDGRG